MRLHFKSKLLGFGGYLDIFWKVAFFSLNNNYFHNSRVKKNPTFTKLNKILSWKLGEGVEYMLSFEKGVFLRVWQMVREGLVNKGNNYGRYLKWTYRPLTEIHSKQEKACICTQKFSSFLCWFDSLQNICWCCFGGLEYLFKAGGGKLKRGGKVLFKLNNYKNDIAVILYSNTYSMLS